MLNKAEVKLFDGKYNRILNVNKKNKEDFWVASLAFLFGITSLNGLYPFGLSFTAAIALYKNRLGLGIIFSFLGNLLMIRSLASLRYLLALIIFTLSFLFFENKVREKNYILGVLTFSSILISGFSFLLARGISPYDLWLLVMESLLAGIMVFIIPCGMFWLFPKTNYVTDRNLCFALLAGSILYVTRGIEVLGVNIRDILSTILVLLMALFEGAGAGAIAGIITGFTGYSVAFTPWTVALLAFSGLCAGSLNKLGKKGVILGFSLGYIIYNFYTNSLGEHFISLPVLLISYIGISIFPKKIIDKGKKYIDKENTSMESQGEIKRAKNKLYEVAASLEHLGKTFVYHKKDQDNIYRDKYLNSVLSDAQAKVCSNCGMYRICWETETKEIIDSFYELIRRYEEKPGDFKIPQVFKKRCNKFENILEIVQEKSRLFNLNWQKENIIKENIDIISQKFNHAAKIMKTLGGDFPQNFDMEGILKEKFLEKNIAIDDIYISQDGTRLKIDIVKPRCKVDKECEFQIPKILQKTYGKGFYTQIIDCPLSSGGLKCRIKATTRGALGVTLGISGVSKDGSDVSGDGFSSMELKSGIHFIALSDGMGVGKIAASHSEKSLFLLEQLLECGFDYEPILRLINSAMILSADGEGFSTMDLAIINTYSGETQFIKAGSPASFIKRNSKVDIIEGGSLPVGIIDDILPKISEIRLKAGDYIIMVTDGIIEMLSENQKGEDLIKRYLLSTDEVAPQKIADRILKMAQSRGAPKDDMTVLVAKLWQRSN